MIRFKFADQEFQTGRVIGERGSAPGPRLVFVAGIHGNEPSGVVALQRVFAQLETHAPPLQGQLLGLAGNLAALEAGERFLDVDLNRQWDQAFTQRLQHPENSGIHEHEEQRELFRWIEPFLDQPDSTFFLDLHTTSSRSEPFMAINDQLNNRRFALSFPVPTVLGIEEYLSGPLLSYLNDLGPVALAFEAGQHEDPGSAEIHESFIWLAMATAGVIRPADIPHHDDHLRRLNCAIPADQGIFEVLFRHGLTPDDGFRMKPGYRNFSPVRKGETVAQDQNGPIRAVKRGRIFMPLYQTIGNDGFFLIRRIPGWALTLSRWLRNRNFDRWLTKLPGVSPCPDQPDTLIVDRSTARFLATQIFHLLGYRRKQDDGQTMRVSRREIVVREADATPE